MDFSSLKGPWTIRQYGAVEDRYDEVNHRIIYKFTGERYRIQGPGIDVHVIYDGSNLKDKYPDGVIRGPQEVRATVALLRAAPDMRDALQRLVQATKAGDILDAMTNAERVLAYATTPVGEQEGT